jgi:hypothetical protein
MHVPVQYQVTGPVLEVRDDAIVAQKSNEKKVLCRIRRFRRPVPCKIDHDHIPLDGLLQPVEEGVLNLSSGA